MTVVCQANYRCEVCPLDKIPYGQHFPLFVDKIDGVEGAAGDLPANIVGYKITGKDVAMGLAARMKLIAETADQVRVLRGIGRCSKPDNVKE